MKKARIILSCIALLAVIGGSLAFRAMISQAEAYTYTGSTTWTSTTVGTKIYSTTVPVCVRLTLGALPAYRTSDILAVPATNVYKTTIANTIFTTTTTVAGATVTTSTTLPITKCDLAPFANTFLTTAN